MMPPGAYIEDQPRISPVLPWPLPGGCRLRLHRQGGKSRGTDSSLRSEGQDHGVQHQILRCAQKDSEKSFRTNDSVPSFRRAGWQRSADAEFAPAVLLVVEAVFLYDLAATFLKPALSPVLVPPQYGRMSGHSPVPCLIDLVKALPPG